MFSGGSSGSDGLLNPDLSPITEMAGCTSSSQKYWSEHIGRLARMSVLDTEVDGSNPGSSMLLP